MASPSPIRHSSTPTNSKGRAPAMPFQSPPCRPGLDAFGHCHESEMAERFLAVDHNEAGQPKRIREAQDKIGTSWDAVAANLRPLGQANARRTGSSGDVSAQYGKEKLSLKDILPMLDNLSELSQENSNLTATTIIQMDKLRARRDVAVEQMKIAQQYQSLHVGQMNAIQQEWDALLQEEDRSRDELELILLKFKRNRLQMEIDQDHAQRLRGQAAEKSTGIGMGSPRVPGEVERERDELLRSSNRYRQERDNTKAEYDSMRNQRDIYQIQVQKKWERELEMVRSELNASKDRTGALLDQSIRHRKERDEARVQSEEARVQRNFMLLERDQYQTRFEDSEEELKDIKGQLNLSRDQLRTHSEQNTRLLQERDRARQECDAHILALREFQNLHTTCEQDKRLQLGRIDRQTFFEDFSEFARSQAGNHVIFEGKENGHSVECCLCVLPDRGEALCLIRRLGGTFIVWCGKVEDCSWFVYDWGQWVCFGREDREKPMYISLSSVTGSHELLRNVLNRRTISDLEADTFRRTRQF